VVEIVYLDTSVFVKRFDAREPRAEQVARRLRGTRTSGSVLLLAETMSAVARKLRDGDIEAAEAERIREAVRKDYRRVLKVILTSAVLWEAERLLFRHPLRASDAVHIGSALILSQRLGIRLSMLTADASMHEAAAGEGMPVEFFG